MGILFLWVVGLVLWGIASIVDSKRSRPYTDGERFIINRYIEEYNKPVVIPVDYICPAVTDIVIPRRRVSIAECPVIDIEEEPEMKLINISKSKDPLKWFQCTHKNLPAPSPAEQLIINELGKYRCVWYREVSFSGLQVNSYNHPRYDIMIQCSKVPAGIVIVEYDGAAYHQGAYQKAMDKLKNKFCKDNGVPIHRFNKKHYYYMDIHIETLMKQYNIRKIV